MSHGQNMGSMWYTVTRSSAPHNHNGILENEDVNPYKSIDDHAPIWAIYHLVTIVSTWATSHQKLQEMADSRDPIFMLKIYFHFADANLSEGMVSNPTD